MREQRGICYRFWHALLEEFQFEKFSLSHEPSEEFFKSQWQRQRKSLLWLIYRWLLAACFACGVFGSIVHTFDQGKWFIFLTDWGFSLCLYTSVFGAVLVTIYHFNKDEIAVSSLTLKIYWFSYSTTLTLATVITFIYWILIYPTDDQSGLAVYNLWAHGFNSILMIFDHMLVAFPARILHSVFAMIIGSIYALFTLCYYYAGGTDPHGNPYIYKILDWSEPSGAVISYFSCMVLAFLFSILHFSLHRLRKLVSYKLTKSQLTLNV